METQSKYDGLVIKQADQSGSSLFDCDLCCMNHSDCEGCPLKSGFYFAPSEPLKSSPMSEADKSHLNVVANNLFWLADYLKMSIDTHTFFKSSVRMSIAYLELQLSRLSLIKTFDK